MATDIEKMYRQILIHHGDRDLQRILWRYHETEAVWDYQLTTVTYGLACAPYLAIRSLRQLADDEEARYPRGSAALRRDAYVNDILTGASTIVDAIEIQKQLIQLCRAGGFPLKKWSATDPRLLAAIPVSDQMHADLRAWEPYESHSLLGLRWHPSIDSFSFTIRMSEPQRYTKRTALSLTAQLFDPLGWLAPVVVRAKIMIQSMWLQGLDWDTPLAERDTAVWAIFRKELPGLGSVRMPRWLQHEEADRLELHGFADASERAYAAVIYLRAVDARGDARTTLIAPKTRVALVKQVSLPRLELYAASLLAKYISHIQTLLQLPEAAIHLWSDSTVTLSWIQGHPSRWKTYVANRVAEIQRVVSNAHWHHVPEQDNPADCASRGLSPKDLATHNLWWTGPSWLKTTSGAWPAGPALGILTNLPDQRAIVHTASPHRAAEPAMLTRHSTLHRLLRVTAWCRRWSQPRNRAERTLQVSELREVEKIWIRRVQASAYRDKITAVSRDEPLPRRSTILKLSPFLDEQGILRVGGRIKHALLSFDEKHPIILPGDSHFTKLCVKLATGGHCMEECNQPSA